MFAMKRIVIFFFFSGIVVGFTIRSVLDNFSPVSLVSPVSETVKEKVEKPLEKYTFDRLKKTQIKTSAIVLGKPIKIEESFLSFIFYYRVDGKKVSGLMNIPRFSGVYPVIVMFRGFVDRSMYTTGEGTRKTAEEFAKNGFITLAPDFLGYGESDGGASNSLEDRFQTYTTAVTLVQSLPKLSETLQATESGRIKPDNKNIGMWGHSNGGHIALSVLAITEKEYPTVLWNPVSKPFPYSVLYFTDEFEDNGKALRKVIADFEKDYDVELYSPPNYYSRIKAPIALHQGEDDESVPSRWSDQLAESLGERKKDIEYFTYPGENHNFTNGQWPVIVGRSMAFYNEEFRKIQ